MGHLIPVAFSPTLQPGDNKPQNTGCWRRDWRRLRAGVRHQTVPGGVFEKQKPCEETVSLEICRKERHSKEQCRLFASMN